MTIRPVFVALAVVASALSTAPSFAQDEDRVVVDVAKIPASAADPKGFAPDGWEVEETASGDLNGDGTPDLAVKLIQVKPADAPDDEVVDRARALVVAFKRSDGSLERAAVAPKLLQCTACGGAFYGVVAAPADVKIEKGVIVVTEDHGSRDVATLTFRFRLDAASGKFLLIGSDYADVDRAAGGTASESTNYLTGSRVTTRAKGGGRDRTTRSTVAKTRVAIDDFDYEKFDYDATTRLGLD